MKLLLALAALAVADSGSLSAAILIKIDPQNQTIAPGTSTAVQVRVSGLGLNGPPSLGGFDFNLAFDPTIVLFTGLTFGDPLLGDQLNLSSTGPVSDFSLTSPGFLDFFEISLDSVATLDSMQPSSFVLATLQFQALTSGATTLVPTLNSVSDSQSAPLTLGFQSGSVTVAATPEPSCYLLVSPAGAWIISRFKRRRKP